MPPPERQRRRPVPFVDRLRELRAATVDRNAPIEASSFLVIGGTGFLGTYLVEDLLARGAREVRILCRTPPSDDDRRDQRVSFRTGSVTDRSVVASACHGVDAVFHTAAAYGTPNFGRFGQGTAVYDVNVGGVDNVIAGCRVQRVPMLVYTSSCNVIFDGRDRVDATEDTPYASATAVDHYSRSKILAEGLVLRANDASLATCVLRPNGIYGPREDFITQKALGIARRLRGLPFSLNPRQRTDWTFAYNLVWAHVLALNALRQRPELAAGKAYFVTDGQALHTMSDVLGTCLERVGVPYRPWIRVPTPMMVYGCLISEWLCHAAGRLGVRVSPPFTKAEALKAVVTHTHCIERANRLLGYEPLFTTTEGLHYMLEELSSRGVTDG